MFPNKETNEIHQWCRVAVKRHPNRTELLICKNKSLLSMNCVSHSLSIGILQISHCLCQACKHIMYLYRNLPSTITIYSHRFPQKLHVIYSISSTSHTFLVVCRKNIQTVGYPFAGMNITSYIFATVIIAS